MDGWKMKSPLGMAYFQVRTVSFREGKLGSLNIQSGYTLED